MKHRIEDENFGKSSESHIKDKKDMSEEEKLRHNLHSAVDQLCRILLNVNKKKTDNKNDFDFF